MLDTVAIELSSDERAALRRAVDRDFSQLSVRLDRAEISAIVQPWFADHRILFIESATVEPALGAHVAQRPDGEYDVLTGRLAAMHELVGREPADLRDAEAAAEYVENVDVWTTEDALPAMTLERFDDLPWRKLLDDAQQARIAAARASHADQITPPQTFEYGDGWRITKWVVRNCELIFRVLDVTRRGELSRTDLVRESKLPVYPGNAWKKVNGKLVPVG